MSVPIQSGKISLRSAGPEDEEFLFKVYSSSRLDEISTWGFAPEQQESFLRMQFRAQQFQYDDIDQMGDSIILIDNRPIGRLIVDRTEREMLLAEIALLTEFRNSGIGTQIISDLMNEATDKGIAIRLHVSRSNRAQRLYERLGFAVVKDTGTHFEMLWNAPSGDEITTDNRLVR